jgi:hypothetical protein
VPEVVWSEICEHRAPWRWYAQGNTWAGANRNAQLLMSLGAGHVADVVTFDDGEMDGLVQSYGQNCEEGTCQQAHIHVPHGRQAQVEKRRAHDVRPASGCWRMKS